MTNRERAEEIVKAIAGAYGDFDVICDKWIPKVESELDEADERGYNRACDADDADRDRD